MRHTLRLFSPIVFACFLLLMLNPIETGAQGCVAIRLMSTCSATDSNYMISPHHFQLTMGYRFYHSYKHFVGTEEQPQRVEQQTEVDNRSSSMDITLGYSINKRIMLNLTVPLVYSSRSSLYEHDRVNRYETSAYGLGDMRISADFWLLNPLRYKDHNILLGAGLKMPTGSKSSMDVFYTANGPRSRPVDQSIQPGDGGWGFDIEMLAYTKIYKGLSAYANAFYLFNPMNTSGVHTYRDSLSPILANEAIMSITDQYMARLGFAYDVWPKAGLTLTLGARIEGVPVRDLLGKSDGFRRPGYVVSIEPGVHMRIKERHALEVDVPGAVLRNRLQSLTDKETEAATGKPRHGDAAFADYLLLITYSYRF